MKVRRLPAEDARPPVRVVSPSRAREELVWLQARLTDLRADAERFQAKAYEYNWPTAAYDLGCAADEITDALVELIRIERGDG